MRIFFNCIDSLIQLTMQPQTHTSTQKGARWRQNCLFQPQVKLQLTVRIHTRPRNPKGRAMDCINKKKKKKNLFIVPKNLQKEIHYFMKIDTAHSVNCDLSREKKMFLLLLLGKHSKVSISMSCKVKVTLSVFHLLVTDILGSPRHSSCPNFFQVYTTSENS